MIRIGQAGKSGGSVTDLKVLEGAEEFSVGQGPTGVLLVHGFTGSPDSMRPLGDYLADRGIGCVGVRLPGHGTTWQDLGTRRASEWVETVDTAYEKMKTEHDEVFVVGLSFGVALALDLAARRSDVPGLVSIAGFLLSKDPRRFLAGVISRVLKSVPAVGNDICDPDGRELCYERVPTGAALQVLRFTKSVRESLPEVTCPILVLHSHNDHTAHHENATLIHERVSSTDKQLVWLDHSYHVLTLDYDRQEVYERTYEFIKARSRIAL